MSATYERGPAASADVVSSSSVVDAPGSSDEAVSLAVVHGHEVPLTTRETVTSAMFVSVTRRRTISPRGMAPQSSGPSSVMRMSLVVAGCSGVVAAGDVETVGMVLRSIGAPVASWAAAASTMQARGSFNRAFQ